MMMMIKQINYYINIKNILYKLLLLLLKKKLILIFF
jgi:hypothetical protein